MTTVADAPEGTATLQMVRADVNVRDFQRWMGTRRLQDPDHAMHCLLTETFGELAPKPFRLMIPRGCRQGTLYGYGTATTAALREAAGAFADPLQLRAVPPAGVDTKPMPPEWQKGKRLGFEIRVRPVVRKARGSERAGAELDAYQVDAETHPKGEMSRSRDEVYLRWLSDRLERNGGAALELEQTKLVSFQRIRSFRKHRGRHVEGPDAVLRGVLSITNPRAFAELLARGIGRHRSYGYGMLLLRPPSRPVGS